MSDIRYLRHINDGTIYEWDEILADNELTEEVTELQAFPEKFVPKKQKKRKAKLSLTTKKIPEQAPKVNVELAAEASKGWPK